MENVIANEKVECNVSNVLNYSFSNGFVKFNFSNGSSDFINLSDGLEFIVPEGLVEMEFQLNGTSENEEICLSTLVNERYLTYEEFRENKINFFVYTAALIVFLIVSIPTFMDKVKKWLEDDKEKQKNLETHKKGN